jgi:actin-related protein
MQSMQERIDALIQMRREKPEHKLSWEKLFNAIIHETDLLTIAQSEELKSAFKEIQQQELLKLWDDRFHEVLITGKITETYTIGIDNSAYASSIAASTTSNNVQLTKDVLTAYDQYKYDRYQKAQK